MCKNALFEFMYKLYLSVGTATNLIQRISSHFVSDYARTHTFTHPHANTIPKDQLFTGQLLNMDSSSL